LFEKISGRFDLITANLPYVGENDPDRKDLPHPAIAVIGGFTGFEIIEECLNELREHLNPDGIAVLEIGYDQGPAIGKTARKLKHFNFKIFKDLNNYDRVLLVSWKAPHPA
jgi:release factor glutamine methyltransferase